MSYNTKVILNEFLTFSNYKITMENCGLFKNSLEWVKLQNIVKSLPDEESRLFYLEAYINKRICEDHKKEFEAKEKAREEKEARDRILRDEKEKFARDKKEKEERHKKEKEEMHKKEKEEKDEKEKERYERELRAKIHREEVERIDREACYRESRVLRHTILAHMGGGVAIGIPVPPIYGGVELRHIGGGTFVPVRKDNSKGGSRVAPGYPLMCHRF